MTINSINPLGSYEVNRLDQLEQHQQETQKATVQKEATNDRVSISEEGRLKASLFKTAQEGDDVRADKVAAAKAQIEAGEYKPEGKDIAASMIRHELDVWG